MYDGARFPFEEKTFQTAVDGAPPGIPSASRSRGAIVLQRAYGPIVKLGRLKIISTVASSGYCPVHLLLTHHFSAYVFLGAVAFGAAATIAIAWITDRIHSSR
jgi:hypothetical protein